MKMDRSICPLLHDHEQGYVCRALNSQYIHEDDAKNICSNSEAFLYCVHYPKRPRQRSIYESQTDSIRMICPKCNSHQQRETLYFVKKETHSSCEFLAYICELCGYTELYKSQESPYSI